MGKHHHHHGRDNNGQPSVATAPESGAAAAVAALGPTEEVTPKVEVAEQPANAEAPAAEPPKKIEPPAPEQVSKIVPTAKKVETSPLAQSAARFGHVPQIASPAGKRMARMINEYYELCANARKDDITAITKCTKKLYDIMNMCVPHSVQTNTASFSELINMLFKALADKRSTLFHDKEIWRASYNLPSPEDCFKFDTFYTVMTQLVDYAKDPSKRPSYNATAIGNVLKSPACFKVLTDIRARLDAR